MKRKISFIMVIVMMFSFTTGVFADGIGQETLTITLKNDILDKRIVEEIFRLIEETPDDVLMSMSESELISYFNENSNIVQIKDVKNETQNEYVTYGWWENTKCGAAIVVAIGGTVFVGAKLLKFKKYIKALGGAKEAAYLVYLYFNYGEIPKELGATAGKFLINLAEMILGIDQIKEQCGHLLSYKEKELKLKTC